MLETRRQILDAVRAGPTLFAGLPGGEVDIDQLAVCLVARGFEGGVHVTDGIMEGVLWIQDGATGETWFLEADGEDAVLPVEPEHDSFRDIVASGVVSVFIGTPPKLAILEPPAASAAGPQVAPPLDPSPVSSIVPPTMSTERPGVAGLSHQTRQEPPPPAASTAAASPPATEVGVATLQSGVVAEPAPDAQDAVTAEPTQRPWPTILSDVMTRVVHHRGPRLAALFVAALSEALAQHGGSINGDRVSAPPLPESTWRAIIEEGCAPVVAIAGRAFTDRTIAAAERTVLEADVDREESL
ncbi:MAG: hypothetical protein ACT4P5_13325 [Armatimonadota bacterium]